MYRRYREKQKSNTSFSLFVAIRKERKLMNAQKTITMDFDEYQAELSKAQKEGYYRAIRAKVEENLHYQKTVKEVTRLEVQLGIHKHTLRDEWDKNYSLKKRLETAEDRVAIYKFLTGLILTLLIFSEVIKALLF